MKILFTTQVGSQIWKMDRPDSDIDTFTAYIVPTVDILSGKNHGGGSHFKAGDEVDKSTHEIGKVIDELIKGNVNFLIGVLSPIVDYADSIYLMQLRELTLKHGLTKSCIPSVRGLAYHNYKKYVIGHDTAKEYEIPKKCGLINRTLLFGMNILTGYGAKFYPAIHKTPESVKAMLEVFDKAAENSTLPERTDPEPFREWLLKVRLYEFNGKL